MWIWTLVTGTTPPQVNTRKSSCVNARDIPSAAYQVLHLLPEAGYPTPRQGYSQSGLTGGGTWGGVPPSRGTPTTRSDRGYSRWDTPGGGTSHRSTPLVRSDRGYPRWDTPGRGTPPSQIRWGIPKVGYPQPGLMGGYPRWSTPLPGPGWGTPPGVARQNDRRTDTCQNITFLRTTYAVGKKKCYSLLACLKGTPPDAGPVNWPLT